MVWLVWLLRGLIRLCRAAARDRGRRGTRTIPAWAVRQPDPLIYSQTFLQSRGLAVTWDNPDIHLELASAPGVVVDSHSLSPATDYVVVARVWNGSTTAPAIDLPVAAAYLEFGVGTKRNAIAATTVDLPVKGAPGCPAFARIPWTTPPVAGHYCLQVELDWKDDAEPANNMGQHNTDVRALNSPHAAFALMLRNDAPGPRLLRLRTDAYQVPPQLECPPDGRGRDAFRREARDRHDPARWPLPAGWTVVLVPEEARLEAGEETPVAIDVTAPDGFEGRQAINVAAYDGSAVVGGVTLYAEGRS